MNEPLCIIAVPVALTIYLTLWILDSDPYGPPSAIAIIAGIAVFLIKDVKISRFTGAELRRYFTEWRLAHLSRPGTVALIAGMVLAPAGFVLFLKYGAAPVVTHYNVVSFDGVTLATDVYRSPFQTNPAPVILVRTYYQFPMNLMGTRQAIWRRLKRS